MGTLPLCAAVLALGAGCCLGQIVQTGAVPVRTLHFLPESTGYPPFRSSLQANWHTGQSGEAYVVNAGVTVVDIATQAVKRIIPLPIETGPTDSCLSSTGLMAVTVAVDTSAGFQPTDLFVVDLAAGTFRNLKPPFWLFQNCVFSGDGDILYGIGESSTASAHNRPQPVALDADSGKVLQTWRIPDYPIRNGLRMLPDGELAIVTESASGAKKTIIVLNPVDGSSRMMNFTGDAYASAVAPNGLLYLSGVTESATDPTYTDVTIDPSRIGSDASPLVADIPSPLRMFSYLAWPSNDPWYVYRLDLSGVITAVSPDLNHASLQTVAAITGPQPQCNGPVQGFTYGIASHRGADGTDTVLALCDGELEFFTAAQAPTLYSVAHGASLEPAPAAPGSFITLFGQALGYPGEYDLPGPAAVRELGNTSVQFDGQLSRLYFVGEGQVNAAVPENVNSGEHEITIRSGNAVLSRKITIVDQNIAAFTWSPDPKAAPAAAAPIVTDAQYRLVGDPALPHGYAQLRPGDAAIIWATGGGRTSPVVDDTVAAPEGTFPLLNPPAIAVDDLPATVLYAGRAPGSASLDQLNILIPASVTPGPHDLKLGTRVYKAALWIQ